MTSRCRGAKKRLSRPTCAGSPDLLLQVVDQIGPRSLQRRAEAEEERGDEADQESDCENGRIRPQMHHDGKIHRAKEIA